MKKYALLAVILIFSGADSFAQIIFEKGYFIDGSGTRVEALIRNVGWRSNPDRFEYKLEEGGEVRQAGIHSISEFGIHGASRYVRAKVQIDRSSDQLDLLSDVRQPVFKEELLFLRVLVDGDANLYMYVDELLTRFFYCVHDSDINQLVYKRYYASDNRIARNNFFMQQIINDLRCDDISPDRVRRMQYNRNSLERKFIKFNACMDPDFNARESRIRESRSLRDWIGITIRPGFNYSTFSVHNSTYSLLNDKTKTAGLRLGLEAEFFLPYYKNSWGIIFEPSFQHYRSAFSIEQSQIQRGLKISKVEYQSVDMQVGLRRYFFLNQNSKVFINASYGPNFITKTNIAYKFSIGHSGVISDKSWATNLAFGTGFKLNNKYSLEARYRTRRYHPSLAWQSDYSPFTVTLGYTLF